VNLRIAFGAFALVGTASFAGLTSCSQTPPNNPIRTFERPERVDFVCMKVRTDDGNRPVAPVPVALAKCTPVTADESSNDLGQYRPYHLYALVTQTTRGEVAVSDITAGGVVDQDVSQPGINFLTVGSLPQDIASTPDGLLTFVASAEPNKPALYAIASHRMLGDAAGVLRQGLDGKVIEPHTTLATWPACSLPEAPAAVAVIKREGIGADDADPFAYYVAALLPGLAGGRARVVTLDVKPFLRGAGVVNAGLAPGLTEAGDRVEPGQLAPCKIASSLELGGSEIVPKTVARGPAWDDGVKYRDSVPPALKVDPASFPVGESAVEPLPFAASCFDPAAKPASKSIALEFTEPLGQAQPRTFVKDRSKLYVTDSALPIVHVVDLTFPLAPKEREPLITSSLTDPNRLVTIKDLAVSPETREYKRYLYAIDEKQGSLMVYDVTDDTSPRMPLTRPHPQSNPFDATDRLTFTAPIAAVQLARFELPSSQQNSSPATGALCNPNANIDIPGADKTFTDPGGLLRKNVTDTLGPSRLRGVFGFVTLTNGQVVTIDVDDWDAPCRRPDSMGTVTEQDGRTFDQPLAPSSLTPAQVSSTTDTSPYAARETSAGKTSAPTTQEAFFPVSAPNRPRSRFSLLRSKSDGVHIPYLASPPTYFDPYGTSIPSSGDAAKTSAKMRPTISGVADPTTLGDAQPFNTGKLPAYIASGNTVYIGGLGRSADDNEEKATPEFVRFSFEDPTVHVDQDWISSYEGTIPGTEGAVTTLDSADGFSSLTLSSAGSHFCAQGVEDWSLGKERAAAVLAEMKRIGVTSSVLADRMVDYAEITDDLLSPTDDYWRVDQACWADVVPGGGNATTRFDTCNQLFDADYVPTPQVNTTPVVNPNRYLPVVEAYDGKLVVTRFSPQKVGSTTYSTVVPPEASNKSSLAAVKCCFHSQAKIQVRAKSQWITKGASRTASPVQFLHHVRRGAQDRCVQSCEARDQLLNGRSPAVPLPGRNGLFVPRNSALALRNPMFSFVMWNGVSGSSDLEPASGTYYTFSTRGGFTAYTSNLAATTTVVNPRGMRYIEPLGQMVIVDGASQGLVLFDLRTLALSNTAFY
jgi:hypothetical protein